MVRAGKNKINIKIKNHQKKEKLELLRTIFWVTLELRKRSRCELAISMRQRNQTSKNRS